MSGRQISLSGEVHIRNGLCSTTVDALETLKVIGLAYGLYDHAEDIRGCRVKLLEGDRPALVEQEDISRHGSPCWQTVRTLTDDPKQIQRYMAFQDTMKMLREMEREQGHPPMSQKPVQQTEKGGRKGHER